MKYGQSLTVRPVRNGLGIAALRAVDPVDLICRVRGRIVTPKTVWGYWKTDPRRGANCYRFDAELYLDPEGEIGAFANHSCNPNARLVRTAGGLQLRALKKIAVGREVTHDYSTQLGADDIWTMRCNCGERNCRRVVANVARLPAAVVSRYRRLEAIPAFIIATL
ncbi:MAG: SET domain-containing protein-lysine N-methyltransferase [Burkholderiales bacterium]